MEIQTERLRLVVQSPAEVLAGVAAMNPSERAEVSPGWLDRIRASTSADPWTHGFVMVDRAGGIAIGSCGFKGPPGADETVEIAYGVDPAYEGQGYATEAVLALVAYAFGSGRVRHIRAHTLPGPNASARVLTRCGFEWVGEAIDPEDGLVWRWEKQNQAV